MKSVGAVHSLNRVNRRVHLERLGQRRCARSSNLVLTQAEGEAVTVKQKVSSQDKKRAAHCAQLSTRSQAPRRADQTIKSVGTLHSHDRVNRLVHFQRLGQRRCARISNLVLIQAEGAAVTVEKKVSSQDK
jgi:hypothetical protein